MWLKLTWTIMCFHIVKEMRGELRPCGFWASNETWGPSVASASAARVSMIRFTQSSCSTLRGSFDTKEPMKAMMRATMLMVNWNMRNFRMLLNTDRPQSTASTIDLKLSSRMTISAASLATSVPTQSEKRWNLFQNQIKCFFEYFDPVHIFLDNENEWFPG